MYQNDGRGDAVSLARLTVWVGAYSGVTLIRAKN